MSRISRRDFIVASAAAGTGLVIGFYLPHGSKPADSNGIFAPNAFLKIERDGRISIVVARSEMGQGVRTALPVILAEELEADWKKVSIVQAPFDRKYGDQETGDSTSVQTSWDMLRRAGATAREMLIEAFARDYNFRKEDCRAMSGTVVHVPTGQRTAYGELVEAAAKLPVPKNVPLKDPREFRLIGQSTPRTDTPSKVTGSAVFGIDVRVPGMLFATVARCPVFGGKLASFDATNAKTVPGVRHVISITRGAAVVAENTWAAMKGREVLQVKWDEGPNAGENSAGLRRQFEELTARPQKVFRNDGDVDAALASAARRVEAIYELPFLAHAPMEPLNCTAYVREDRCEVWVPTQVPAEVHARVRRITGLPAKAIRVNVTLLGGGFGRRWYPDEVDEAVEISKQIGAPVQVVWTREDDIQHDYYRPASFHRMTAGLEEHGWPIAWIHRFASTAIQAYLDPKSNHPEAMELGGATDFPYNVPNVRVEYVPAASAVPPGWWRAVAHNFNAFVVQSFLDELAAAAEKDPYEFRMQLLREPHRIPPNREGTSVLDTRRLRDVLALAASKADWGKPLSQGCGRGLAHHFSSRSYAAEVVEVSVTGKGRVRVERVVCAVDCGIVVNPDIVKAQLEGGIVYGLTAALKGEITFDRGRVQQSNFHDYKLLGLPEMPVIEVHLVPSSAPPTGVGELGVPTIAPALTNAIFAASGRRIRRLPIQFEDLGA
jgi:isoquinoline 1-oxidoreductase beta subunit